MLSAVSQSSLGDPLGPFAVTSFVGLSDLFYKLAQLVGMLCVFFQRVICLYERKRCSACDLTYPVMTAKWIANTSVDCRLKN